MSTHRIVGLGCALLAVAASLAADEPARIYAKSCAPCHGKEGRPSALFTQQGVRDFTSAAWQKGTTDAEIDKVIREGKKGTMMASFAGQLTPEETKSLVAYIRKLGPKK